MSRLPAAERREQLLDCAASLFAEHGYARATTNQLAKAAGVTEPIIYRHFKSKRDMYIALIKRTGKRTLDQWKQDLKGATDPADRLRRLIGDNPMVSTQARDAYRVFLQAISEVEDQAIQNAVNEHIASVHTFLATELERAQQAHRVTNKFSADILAWLLIDIGMGYGMMSALKIHNHSIDPAGTHVQQVLARVLVGKDTP